MPNAQSRLRRAPAATLSRGLAFAFALLALMAWAGTVRADAPTPSRDYAPDQVVALVIDALKNNDESTGDDGIATVYAFASPANRRMTGPLPRFTDMVKMGYGEMLNHRSSRRSDVKIEGDTAWQAVWLTTPQGEEIGYMFKLGRQAGGEFEGMWMTDAVYPLKDEPEGLSI